MINEKPGLPESTQSLDSKIENIAPSIKPTKAERKLAKKELKAERKLAKKELKKEKGTLENYKEIEIVIENLEKQIKEINSNNPKREKDDEKIRNLQLQINSISHGNTIQEFIKTSQGKIKILEARLESQKKNKAKKPFIKKPFFKRRENKTSKEENPVDSAKKPIEQKKIKKPEKTGLKPSLSTIPEEEQSFSDISHNTAREQSNIEVPAFEKKTDISSSPPPWGESDIVLPGLANNPDKSKSKADESEKQNKEEQSFSDVSHNTALEKGNDALESQTDESKKQNEEEQSLSDVSHNTAQCH